MGRREKSIASVSTAEGQVQRGIEGEMLCAPTLDARLIWSERGSDELALATTNQRLLGEM